MTPPSQPTPGPMLRRTIFKHGCELPDCRNVAYLIGTKAGGARFFVCDLHARALSARIEEVPASDDPPARYRAAVEQYGRTLAEVTAELAIAEKRIKELLAQMAEDDVVLRAAFKKVREGL